MTFTIKSFISSNGERFPLLFSPDEEGIPLFYPCAFVSRSLRTTSTHQTKISALDGIRRLSEWERDRNLGLEVKFLNGALLAAHEIDDLAAHVRLSRKGTKGAVISARKFNIYWFYICSYINWLTDELLPNRNDLEVRKLVIDQETRLKKRLRKRVDSTSRKNQRLLDEKLSDNDRNKLLDLFQSPLQGLENSDQHHGTRFRNIVMLRVLYETGMRRGELLSLRIRNFIESSGGESAYLAIEKNHDDAVDRRTLQPVAKTLGRDVPISQQLEDQIIAYRVQYRASLPNVGHSEDDYIFCVHQSGRNQGQPLSINGFNSTFIYLRKTFPELGEHLHSHAFRHDWNYRFSNHADKSGISEREEIESREQAMGWVPGSNMAQIYNQRHRREKAMMLGREVAKDTMRPKNK